jgi:Protein of unknown function (DUF2934)
MATRKTMMASAPAPAKRSRPAAKAASPAQEPAAAPTPPAKRASGPAKTAKARSAAVTAPAALVPAAVVTAPATPKAATEATAVAVVTPEQRRHYIEVAAFYIAERRGFTPGDPMADWLAAQAEIDRAIASGRLGRG